MKSNPKKTHSTVFSQPQMYAPDYGDLTFASVKLEEVKSLHILSVTLDSKLKPKTHLREVVSKAAWSLGIVCCAGKLFDCLQCTGFAQSEVLWPHVDAFCGVSFEFAG